VDMTIFEHLKQEHDEMRQMMSSVMQGYDAKTFKELATELEKHQEAEEEVLYNRVKDEHSVRELVFEGIEEHHSATDTLKKLIDTEGGTESWMAKMKVLHHGVEHHMSHEEEEFFPKCEQLIPRDEAMQMTEDFETTKQRVPTHA
jgi:hemerythrin superfamily protein